MGEDAEKKGGNMGLTRKLMSLMNEDLTDDQAIELMREELGEKSQKKMEELIKQGYSAKEVMQKMMAEGQTKEEELKETAETMKHLLGTKKKKKKKKNPPKKKKFFWKKKKKKKKKKS